MGLFVTQRGPVRKWFTAIPMAFREVPEFWERDAGLLCKGFQALGVESRFIAIGQPQERTDLPLILTSEAKMREAAWWRGFGLDGVVIYSWGLPRYTPVVRAIRESGAKLVVHLDTDGCASSRVRFWRYIKRTHDVFRDQGKALPWLMALAKTAAYHTVPAAYDQRMLDHIAHADLITMNAPLAKQLFRRLASTLERADLLPKVRVLPAPVATDCDYPAGLQKKPQIVACGRWRAYQKDAERLVRVLAMALAQQPHYAALIAGSGTERVAELLKKVPAGPRQRMQVLGYVGRNALIQTYRESRIVFVPSRHESYHLGAAEGLCCGASVVGPAEIASINFFTGASSGTLAVSRSAWDLADALVTEMEAWDENQRRAEEISRHWQARLLAPAVAAGVLNALDGESSDTRVGTPQAAWAR